MGRRPLQPAHPGKVDRESGCGPSRGQPSGCLRRPSRETEGFLLSASSLPSELIEAYRETHYRVLGYGSLTLLVDQANPELEESHRRHQTDCSAFITACNPFSRNLSDEENADRQKRLAVHLRQSEKTFFEGIGQHPMNDWGGEASFLVFGLSLKDASSLCMRYEQNGFVWSGADAVPQLILLR